jgi:L-arabinokinase
VPEGSGISSSAALEVATMRAVLAATGQELAPEAMAMACQWVENHVVDAPCGIMDQMTSACGRAGQLLRLRCQPAQIEGFAAVPAGYRFYGIDSGVRHAVTGADYGTVRVAAFMGLRMLAGLAGERASSWDGYLARVSPEEFARYEDRLHERMPGAEFLERFGATVDAATTVAPDRAYPVRVATRHPVFEQRRVERFLALLGELDESPDAAMELGRLMRGSHDSYGSCGLGSEGTDRLVELVDGAGTRSGLFGARITGGGSGGTVAIFGTDAAASVVSGIAARYREETGRGGTVFG